MKGILIALASTLLAVTALCQRMPIIEHYKDSANTVQFKITVPRDSLLYGPWVTIGPETYQEYAQTMWEVTDSTYETLFTFIYMVGTVTAPERIAGNDFADQSGIVVETGNILGFIEPGDWIRYLARDLTGRTKIGFRYSYGNAEAGRTMEVRIDSPTGPVIAQWTHVNTGSWTTFSEAEIDITVPQSGLHELFLVFTGSPGYVMNIDWLELRK